MYAKFPIKLGTTDPELPSQRKRESNLKILSLLDKYSV